MKEGILITFGTLSSLIAGAFGGWDNSIITLLIFMCIDYITGLIVAGVFHKSTKSDTGALESKSCWKGLIRKGATLLVIVVACRLDIQIGTTYIRDGVCIAFIVNETLSIIENVGLMGVPIPQVISKAIDILNKRGEINE